MRIAGPARRFILSLSKADQKRVLKALRVIEKNPLAGIYLPFPWVGALGYGTKGFTITYRVNDGEAEITGVVRVPTLDDIMEALRQRRGS